MDQRARKLARISAGLSQEQAARAVGISQSRYSSIERGTIEPDGELAGRIAAVLGVEVGELFAHVTEVA